MIDQEVFNQVYKELRHSDHCVQFGFTPKLINKLWHICCKQKNTIIEQQAKELEVLREHKKCLQWLVDNRALVAKLTEDFFVVYRNGETSDSRQSFIEAINCAIDETENSNKLLTGQQ